MWKAQSFGLLLVFSISMILKVVCADVCQQDYPNCTISEEICQSFECLFSGGASQSQWPASNCLTCDQPPGTKVEWTFKGQPKLPPNVCVSRYVNKVKNITESHLKAPKCFVSNEINKGQYRCLVYNETDPTRQPRMESSTFDVVVKATTEFELLNSRATLKCPFSFCAKNYRWQFSKTLNGWFGPLPHGVSASDNTVTCRMLTKDTAGYYKCIAELRSGSTKSASRITHLKIQKGNDIQTSFTSCSPHTCAVKGESFFYSCNGTFRQVVISSQSLTFSCEMQNGSSAVNVFSPISIRIKSSSSFNESFGGYQFWGNFSQNSFEAHARIMTNESSRKLNCSFTLTDFKEYFRTFSPCFDPPETSYTWLILVLAIPISSFVLLVLMAIICYRFEYEIRFAKYRLSARLSKYEESQEPRIMILYHRDRSDLADDVEDFLNEEFDNVHVEKLHDGLAGEDTGTQVSEKMMSTTHVIVFLEGRAFEEKNGNFVEAMRHSVQKLLENNLQILYILFERKDFAIPESFQETILNKDLKKFSSRDRKIVLSGKASMNSTDKSNLVKRLRLMLPVQMSEKQKLSQRRSSQPNKKGLQMLCIR